eukprot:PITA_07681
MARYRVWLGIFCFLLAVQSISAFVYRIGGRKGWVVPRESDPDAYNHWAGSHRFQIGDSLLFKYPRGRDTVLVVTEQAYNTCNTTSPVVYADNGDSIFRFTASGPFFFISGVKGNCLKGQKLVVVVMGQRDSSVGWHLPGTRLPQAPSATPLPQTPADSPAGNSPGVVLSPADSPAYRVPITTGAAYAVSSARAFAFSLFSALVFMLLFL